MAQYKVKGPDGVVRTLEGPDGATDAEVLAVAAKTFGGNVAPATPELSGAALSLDRLKNIGIDLGRGAGKNLDFMANVGQVAQNPALLFTGKTRDLGAASLIPPRQTTSTSDEYMRAMTEGVGGSLLNPAGSLAKVGINAVTGALSGIGQQAGRKLTGGNPIAEIIGSILGGGVVGVGSSIANSSNAPALARETLKGIPSASLDVARVNMVNAQKNLPAGINLSQAMNTPSNIDDVVNALAGMPQGEKLIAQLRAQPEQIAAQAKIAAGSLPGTRLDPQMVANRSQDAATATIQAAKGERASLTKDLFEKAPPIPVQVGTQMANMVQAEQFKPGTSVAAKEAMGELVSKLMPANTKTIAPQDIHTAIREFRAKIKGTPLAPGDSKDFGQMSSLEGKLREALNASSPSTNLGNVIFADITNSTINPMKKGIIGQVAGVSGSADDRAAAGNRLLKLFADGTPDPSNSAITTFELATRKSDPTLFTDAVKTHIVGKLESIPESGNRVAPNFGAQVQKALAGTPAQEQGLRDQLAGVARSQGVPPADVVNGFMRFIDASVAAARRPNKVSGLPAQGIEDVAGQSMIGGVLTSVTPGRQGDKIKGIFSGNAKRTVDALLTTPEGLDTLRKLAKVDPNGPKAQIILSTFMGGIGASEARPLPDTVTTP